MVCESVGFHCEADEMTDTTKSRPAHDMGDVDTYGNPTDGSRIINCCFPDCGCNGSRLCMAERGPNNCAAVLNLEFGIIK